MTTEAINEQRKLQQQAADDAAKKAVTDKAEAEEKATAMVDKALAAKKEGESDFLTQAKTLREEQAKLIEERNKLEAEKTEFKKIMGEAEKEGKSLAGDAVHKEPTKEEKATQDAKKLIAGSGMEGWID